MLKLNNNNNDHNNDDSADNYMLNKNQNLLLVLDAEKPFDRAEGSLIKTPL